MKNIFDKNFSRRNFLKTSAKIFVAYSMFDFFSNVAEAKRKKNSDAKKKSSKTEIEIPEPKIKVEKFLTLDEMKIHKTNLKFAEMDLREYTGAIVIHHCGLLRGDVDSKIEDIHRMHVEKNKWSGIGYHFLIHKDGEIEFARPLECKGAHTFKNNEFTVGICLAGNYQFGEPPTPQLNSAVQLIGALCEKYKFQPTDTTIFGHRDLGKTACPGRNLYALLPEMIQTSRKILKLT